MSCVQHFCKSMVVYGCAALSIIYHMTTLLIQFTLLTININNHNNQFRSPAKQPSTSEQSATSPTENPPSSRPSPEYKLSASRMNSNVTLRLNWDMPMPRFTRLLRTSPKRAKKKKIHQQWYPEQPIQCTHLAAPPTPIHSSMKKPAFPTTSVVTYPSSIVQDTISSWPPC